MRIEDLKLHNRLPEQFEADPIKEVYPRQVEELYSYTTPTPAPEPRLICVSQPLLSSMGLQLEDFEQGKLLDLFSGHASHPNAKPYSTCYGGFQFGQWAGQLGDGRAIHIGDLSMPNGSVESLQLKGAGPTPYSRHADGYAVLRSSVREFLCSEAMHHLGIPTTRALCLLSTGKPIVRDMFYDGNPKAEPGAIVCRTSPSFLRFGHFDLLKSRQQHEQLKKLIHFAMDCDTQPWAGHDDESMLAWYASVCERTLDLAIHWQRVGFVHGVLNTDNMSLLGESIDYGPYGWLEDFDLQWTPNTTDSDGKRYSYGKQPSICYWNLQRLAEAIAPAFENSKDLLKPLEDYKRNFPKRWQEMMLKKMGLLPSSKQDQDQLWIQKTLELLSSQSADYTLFFRSLSELQGQLAQSSSLERLANDFYREPNPELKQQLESWLKSYREKVQQQSWGKDDGQRQINMKATNPKYVLRNFLCQTAIEMAEQGDESEIQRLLEIFEKPYDDQPNWNAYATKRPDWAKDKAGCSTLSCSS